MSPPDPMLAKAISAHQAGRIQEAKAIYERMLRRRPNDPDVLNFLGMLEFQRGEEARGIGLLEGSLRSAPENPHAWLNLGNMRLATGDREAAATAYERATDLAPGMWQAWLNRGTCLRHLRRLDEAIKCLDRAIQLNPNKDAAYERLGTILYALGRKAELVQLYSDWLKYNPDHATARHMYAAAVGEAPPDRASDDYVRETFDSFADTFDEKLAHLEYRAPELIAAALRRYAPSLSGGRPDILDAGVGTGLLGPLLRDGARTLVGVDLSPRMLDKARSRGIYDELAARELCSFMRDRPGTFDIVASADTLVYFGALEEAAAAAHGALRPGGLFAFSVERWDTSDPEARFRLGAHGRYQHGPHYVRRTLEAAGYAVLELANEVLRTELEVPVDGLLVTARR